ncbi:unannotated protein [freshwater metagenome]|jgi:hypothetical protein|uniref:Unannotated protein n=1 Tax=freshwater metagenome TaxID=449393 RepID=A0A6J7V262_9ZZZZ|nr:DUF2017 family protein [Actinomycetota bacterium]TRZ84978.1 MAG: DUF2017 domain-containing protein [Streptomycetaceae bacterium]MSX49132.1 DUF2017 family protein [Actinomycetota bacterium]MSX62514.1 DUF2017 family protein [Actinomycetota bacterium]MSY09781.1 DUF2017 family protein [Actinomycetota bacterium]
MTTNSGFSRHGKNSFIAHFGQQERDVLVNLSEQLVEILAERIDGQPTDPLEAMIGFTGHDSPPDDEVLLRLLPNAYADPVDSSEFRRYTESVLREKKRMNAMAIRSHLLNSDKTEVALDHQTAQAWLGGMNDIRLALGVRLNVEANSHEQLELLSPDDPMRGVYAVYSWLGWLQGTLVDSLMDDVEG